MKSSRRWSGAAATATLTVARPVTVTVTAALCSCRWAPMTYLRTFGPAADPITSLGWGLIVICSLVVLVIAGLVLIAASRARIAPGGLSSIDMARPTGGMRWIVVGTAVSTLVLLGIMGWTLFTLAAVASAPSAPALTIEIRAHQWWWEARYIEGAADQTFITANELHVPVGKPVRLKLIGDDVIHSFWIPALAGKTDVIPGQTNVAWIEATTSGLYRGQCTEYCGTQHAHMAESVIAEPERDFQAWRDRQLTDAPAPATPALQRGLAVFLDRCAVCHTIRGTGGGGIAGPDLTHLMSRHTLAAGTLPNDAPSLRRWLADSQAVKPGCQMPRLGLAPADLDAITAYARTLR